MDIITLQEVLVESGMNTRSLEEGTAMLNLAKKLHTDTELQPDEVETAKLAIKARCELDIAELSS